MPSIDWQVAEAIATVVSSITIGASAIAVVLQLRQSARGQFFSVTAHLFEIWQSPEFQRDQLFLLHKLGNVTWEDFCAGGRGERAERALHRVGGYYDRVGNLVQHNLIHKEEILPTIGGYAVAVWYRIEPLVKELRLRENAVLFENYESLLPECHDCYVPGVAGFAAAVEMTVAVSGFPGVKTASEIVEPLGIAEPLNEERTTEGARATPETHTVTNGTVEATTGMDAQNSPTHDDRSMTSDFALPDTDGVKHRLSEFTAAGPAAVIYVRGAYCPFCMRQLSDYAERYRDFKQAGIEVVALSPESPRKSRRLRTGLKLPFTVLSDTKLEAAKSFGLIGREHPGSPAPATLMIDNQGKVRLSTINQGTKCLVARDILEYGRTLEKSGGSSLPPPQVQNPRPGWSLFARAIGNMALGLVSR